MGTEIPIGEILSKFQAELKAPKNQNNSFGGYKYRSCEDILEGLKPLMKEHCVTVVLSDAIEMVGDRIYVKSTATIGDGKDSISSTAFAREAEIQKGMTAPQITGSASSYARKYALNGLFAIDDTKDSDHDSQHVSNAPATNNLITDKQHQEIRKKFKDAGIDYQSACMDWSLKNFSELFVATLPQIDDYILNYENNNKNT